ncbi:DNA replication and repair protein RecF [mine drainage metagenome]|uniref:DNA replication and repair protein RecF n=1 Tax=mine drainage metagenome TaxID=410659 RepID=A0A1J5T513_9ZZZZ
MAAFMRLGSITVQDFRNLAPNRLEFSGRRQFLVGGNGQGKTNLLEAVGLLTALRSFRASDHRLLIAHGRQEAGVACELEHERLGATRVRLSLRGDGKDAWIDQERIGRMGDFLGVFPTVVLCSQDQQLIRGGPGVRRRWLDLTLAATDRGYLAALQTYHRALAERNALLRTGEARAELGAFEASMAPAAAELIRRRTKGLEELSAVVRGAYSQVSGEPGQAGIGYRPDMREEGTVEAIARRLSDGRDRDLRLRSTTMGPHRDDFDFLIDDRPARDFGSEGQQRLLVVALRLAQAAWFRQCTGVEPVLLADDVVGELDPERRSRFWAALPPDRQVIATGTELPPANDGAWELFTVRGGAVAGGE